MENKNNLEIFDKNNFVYFTLPKKIKTYLNDKGEEKKKLPFSKNLSWKEINKDNYKDFVNNDDKSFFILTGKVSNITVIDFDDSDIYDTLLGRYPDLKNHYTVKTNRGYHIYFKYESEIKTLTNVNGLKGIDTRNDGGLIIAPPTKYKLLDGSKVQYKYLYGEILEIPEFLLNQLLPEEEEQPKDKPKDKKRKEFQLNEGKSKEAFIERLINLLDDSRADDRDEWKDIAFIINNELGKDGLNIFESFSSRSDKYDKNTDNKWYLDLKQDQKGLFMGSLIHKVKEDNKEEYENLYNEFVKQIEVLEYEQDIAEYIIKTYLKNNFVCVSTDKKAFYYYNGNIWKEDEANLKILNFITVDYINEIMTNKKELENKLNDNPESKRILNNLQILNRVIAKLKGKITNAKGILDWIALKLCNPRFYDLCNQNIYLLGFNNGVYDTQIKEFRKGKPDDYITKSTGYDFPTESTKYKSDIEDFLRKVYPNENVRNYTLQMLANCITGGKFEDVVLTHTGRGSNGKSILQQLIKNTFGEYFYEIPSSYLTKQNKMEAGKPDALYTNLNGIRIATSNEPADGQKMNDSLIKIIGSKEGIQYRTLYSNVIETLNIQFVLNIFCNNKIEYNGNDGGMQRRLKVIDYNSKFITKDKYTINGEKNNLYLADNKLSERVKLWNKDFMLMLIELYDPDYKYKEPIEIENSSKKYADDNNDVQKFVKDHFILTNDPKDYLLLKDLKLMYQQNKEYEQTKLKNLKEHLEREFNAEFKDKAKIKIRGKFTDVRSIIYGWKMIETEIDSDEELNPLDL